MERLFWPLFDKFVRWLATLNPATKEAVEALRNKVAALNVEHERLLREVAESERVNAELGRQRVINAIERGKLEDAIQQAKVEMAAMQAEFDALPSRDKLRLPL